MTTKVFTAETRLSGAAGQSSIPLFVPPEVPDALLGKIGVNLEDQMRKERLLTVFDDAINIPAFISFAAWLHCKWNSHCYALYAEYYYEAWVTKTQDADDERLPVELLEIRWRHGETRGHEAVENAAMIAKSDRVYGNGWSCESNICLNATATWSGKKWGMSSPSDCVWG